MGSSPEVQDLVEELVPTLRKPDQRELELAYLVCKHYWGQPGLGGLVEEMKNHLPPWQESN